MVKVFVSYSHADEALRQELDKHLTMLRRQGTIDLWNDRRIPPGDDLGNAIDAHLEEADIVLLLVSPDFLASSYCYDVELNRAMERHRAGDARVIPVILRACDWHGAPFGNLLATPTDGKPVSRFPDLDSALLEVTHAIRKAAELAADSPTAPPRGSSAPEKAGNAGAHEHSAHALPHSGNLGVRTTFTDKQRADFQNEAFDYIARYFQGSLQELEKRNPTVETRFRRIDGNHFTSSIYESGALRASCTVRLGGRLGDITYAQGESADAGTANDWLTVEDDGTTIYLTAPMLQMGRRGKLTMEGAAEHLWDQLLKQAR